MEEKRCNRCIMPEKYPGIRFNSEGICSYCTSSDKTNEATKTDVFDKDKLITLIGSGKSRGDYDCVVPVSGGKDSIYVLYYAVRHLNLRPLAVSYSSGFQTQMALENINNACKALNVTCIIEKADKNVQDKLFRESLRISKTIGSYVRTCLNCSTLIKAIPMKVAKEKKIPFILWGDSIRESVRLVKMMSKKETTRYEDIRSRSLITMISEKISRLREVNMTPYKLICIFPRLVRYRFLSFSQMLSLGVPYKNILFPNKEFASPKNGPQIIHFFDYIDWDPVKDLTILEKELGWKHPPDRTSRFDCCLYCFANHGTFQTDGITADGIIACNLIREGLLSREDALKTEQQRAQIIEKECRDVINMCGLEDVILPLVRKRKK